MAEHQKLPESTPEGKHYDPEGSAALESTRRTVGVLYMAALGFVVISMGSGSPAVIGFAFLSLFLIAGVGTSTYNRRFAEHEAKVFERKQEEEARLRTSAATAEELMRSANRKLEEQSAQIDAIQRANTIGDVIIHNNQAPVIISSTITNSFNTISMSDPDLASAIKTLGGFIEESGNREAAQYFDELHRNVAAENPNPTVLRALWNGIVAALPPVERLTTVVAKITALF